MSFTYDGVGEVPDNVTTVIVSGSVETIPPKTFFQRKSLTTVVFSKKIFDGYHYDGVSIGKQAFEGCTNLRTVEFQTTDIKTIDHDAFYGCYSLKTMTIPEGVQSIGNMAFHSCKSLTEVKLPKSLRNIGDDAFRNCTSLENITIPPRIQTISKSTFMGCSSLQNVVLPEGLQEIKRGAFQKCSSLQELVVPASVRKVANDAFDHTPIEGFAEDINQQIREKNANLDLVYDMDDNDDVVKPGDDLEDDLWNDNLWDKENAEERREEPPVTPPEMLSEEDDNEVDDDEAVDVDVDDDAYPEVEIDDYIDPYDDEVVDDENSSTTNGGDTPSVIAYKAEVKGDYDHYWNKYGGLKKQPTMVDYVPPRPGYIKPKTTVEIQRKKKLMALNMPPLKPDVYDKSYKNVETLGINQNDEKREAMNYPYRKPRADVIPTWAPEKLITDQKKKTPYKERVDHSYVGKYKHNRRIRIDS